MTFDNAKYYRHEHEYDDTLHHFSVAWALADLVHARRIPGVSVLDTIQALGPVVLYAYGPDKIDQEWIAQRAEELANSLARTFRQQFGGRDAHRIDDRKIELLITRFADAIGFAIPYVSTSRCDLLGSRTFSPAEIEQQLRSDPEFAPWFDGQD